MSRYRICFLLIVFAAAASPASAQGLFGKKTQPIASKSVDQLIAVAQTSEDAGQRADAVQDLRDVSAATHPEIVPVLVNILQSDKSITVRIEAAQSLGRIRPVTKLASDALAEAAAKDSALRVRWQARTALTVLSFAGQNPGVSVSDGPGSKVKVSNKEAPINGPVLVPQHGAGVLVPGSSGQTPTGSYSLPLPKGPNDAKSNVPAPSPTGPIAPAPIPAPIPPVATPPLAGEPPLAPPAPLPPMNPSNDPPPVIIPDVGPILAPPQ